ncbi:ribbon-helix-helix protein, CopG family [Acidihalobacter yilgarnensis]|nr:ribbon-helix-helix protein, CopG family [Acidihalobacter yilgarnensis]
MSDMKTHVSYRLSEEALRLLKRLAAAKGISMASVLEIAIREAAKKESLR